MLKHNFRNSRNLYKAETVVNESVYRPTYIKVNKYLNGHESCKQSNVNKSLILKSMAGGHRNVFHGKVSY